MNMRLVRLASLCVLVGSTTASIASHAAADLRNVQAVPGEILVGFSSVRSTHTAAAGAVTQVGNVAGFDARLNAARVKLRPGVSVDAAIANLRSSVGISYAEPNYLLHTCATPNDPAYKTLQYAPQKIQANASWDIWKPRNKVVIAVIDTGVEATHPDLTSVIYRDSTGAVVGWNTLNNTSASGDDGGHGTHCAGVALGHINDSTGLAGTAGWNPNVANSDDFLKLMPIKALDASGTGTAASIASAIIWAADHGAQVMTISAATSSASSTLENAVQYAWGKGCVIVAAAGNMASDMLMYPAAYPNVLSVAATDATDTLLFYSEYGSWIKCAAPGSNVYSTYKSGSYTGLSGTSVAAPHVAAEAAAILSQNPTLSNSQVNDLVTSQVDPVNPYQGRALSTDSGRINVYRALMAAGDGLPTLTIVSFNPATIANQGSSEGTVQLGGPAPAGGVVVSLVSANTAIATVPASVTIPAGATSATFTVSAKYVEANSTVKITASASGKSVSGSLAVNGPTLTGISVNPSAVAMSTSFTGTVTLDTPAPTGGAVVTLSNNGAGLISTPSTVTVPQGVKSASFNGSAGEVTRRTSVTITAAFNGGTGMATLIINQVQLAAISVSPTTVPGASSATGTVTLSSAAPSGGAVVGLSSSVPSVASVPSSITVPAGSTSGTFKVVTNKVSDSRSVTISGSNNGILLSTNINVTTATKSLTIMPNSLVGGGTSKGTVTLPQAAPAGGVVVTLSSSSSAAKVPASVTVPAGAASATFSIPTTPVAANVTATITASFSGTTASANLTIKVPNISRVTLNPTTVVGGTSSKATVNLNGKAPAGGIVVNLSSNNAAAGVPASVTVPAGAATASFAVSTSSVSANVIATISGTTSTATRSAALTITP